MADGLRLPLPLRAALTFRSPSAAPPLTFPFPSPPPRHVGREGAPRACVRACVRARAQREAGGRTWRPAPPARHRGRARALGGERRPLLVRFRAGGGARRGRQGLQPCGRSCPRWAPQPALPLGRGPAASPASPAGGARRGGRGRVPVPGAGARAACCSRPREPLGGGARDGCPACASPGACPGCVGRPVLRSGRGGEKDPRFVPGAACTGRAREAPRRSSGLSARSAGAWGPPVASAGEKPSPLPQRLGEERGVCRLESETPDTVMRTLLRVLRRERLKSRTVCAGDVPVGALRGCITQGLLRKLGVRLFFTK
ncbi:translation initiation factor IF-2 [Apus apus]|uniref:translation initiation factor IF-2 n=1 Tax=Apus apus TaxID=8895 RepID=UPI0021F91B5E|nr:translation initiation factor IF-2 [Apus apus]